MGKRVSGLVYLVEKGALALNFIDFFIGYSVFFGGMT